MMEHAEITLGGLDFRLMISQEEIRKKVIELGQKIMEDYANDPPLFIGVLNGAFVFAADLMRAVDLSSEVTFVRFSSYRGLSSTGKVQTLLGLDEGTVKGRSVIVVEDIVDTGKTLSVFIEDLKKLEPASVKIAALLLKPEALQHPIHVDYLGFSIPPAFVIGYGLDFNEQGRHLPGIYQKK